MGARWQPATGGCRKALWATNTRSDRIFARRWLVDWDDDGVDAEAWLHPPSRGQGDGATLTLSHVDPDADFSYDYADLAFTRERDCP